MVQLTITVTKFITDQILDGVKNKSARIEELIIKGYLAEKGIDIKKALSEILLRKL